MRLFLERLESRQLLATVTWEGDLVTVVGTEFDDTIVAEIIDSELVFTASDVRIPVSDRLTLDVQLLDGNDSFTNNTPLRSTVDGGAGDDRIVGGDGNDTLIGGAGNDHLQGGGGDDRLEGGNQPDDRLLGGDGIDYIVGVKMNIDLPSKTLTVRGTLAADDIRVVNDGEFLRIDGAQPYGWDAASVQKVVVYLGAGDDFFANETTHTVEAYGEQGDDDLSGGRYDLLDGGEGDDLLQGSRAVSRIGWVNGSLVFSGTEADDRMILRREGTQVFLEGMHYRWNVSRHVVIYGLAGDDRLINLSHVAVSFEGGDGDDVMVGGVAGAVLSGGAGNDTLLGTRSFDTLSGGTGNDRLFGGHGGDIYTLADPAGNEVDVIYDNDLTDANNADALDFSLVHADIVFDVATNRSTVRHEGRQLRIRGAVVEKMFGGSGDDVLNSHPATLVLEGNSGDDQILGNNRDQHIRGGAGNDTIRAGGGRNTIFGDEGHDTIYGGNGGNTIEGNAGDDTILGGFGPDNLAGGDGDDAIEGRGGGDRFNGGAGKDRLIASGGGNNHFDGGPGDNYIQGGDGPNTIFGGSQNDVIHGGRSRDLINGGEGDDQIFGLAGHDVIYGSTGFDTLDGGEGNDEIWGGAPPQYTRDMVVISGPENFPNILLGGPGDDVLIGSLGADRLSGGSGVDTLTGDAGEDTLLDGARDDGDILDSIELFPPNY